MHPSENAPAPFRAWWDEAAQVVRGEWVPGSVCGEPEAQASTAVIEGLGKAPFRFSSTSGS